MPQAPDKTSPAAGPWRRRVLVTRLSALGDVAMTVPALYSACRRQPDTLFVLVTRQPLTGIFVNAPANLSVTGIDTTRCSGLAGLWRLARGLFTHYRPDLYADMHDVLRTKVLRLYASLHGVPVAVIDKGRAAKRRIIRRKQHRLPAPLPSSHSRYADTLRRLGLECEPERDFTTLYSVVPADHSLYAAAAQPPRPGERRIGVAPFAAHGGKIYPATLMRRVLELLTHDESVHLYLFGAGEAERAMLDEWQRTLPRTTSLASLRIGFAGELALMSTLDIMLTMDSGNMHLASLTGTRVVSIWGATHPVCGFGGWHTDDSDTLQLDLGCRPCSVYGNRPCARGDLRCLNGITPESVAGAVMSRLKTK